METPSSVRLLNSLPYDIALNLASSLEVVDVCSLGSCSRYWRDVCESDTVWKSLYRERWLDRPLGENSLASQHLYFEAWRRLYIIRHHEMVAKADLLKGFLEMALASESLEVGKYMGALQFLDSLQFGFRDVQMLLLKPKLSVLLNLIGLHYCIAWLNIPAGDMIQVLNSCNISERQVCVQWWKLGRWVYGFRPRDELHSRSISLVDLSVQDSEVLGVLHRGAIHEVIRVQILPVVKSPPSWSYQVNRG